MNLKLPSELSSLHGLRISENRVLRRILRPKRGKRREAGENCIMRSFITCIGKGKGKVALCFN
jgi:hypothetical protein